MSKIIGILSGKGGVGKTSLVANLGAALTNEFRKNVVIVDANVSSSHLGLHLGIYEDLPITMLDLLKKNMQVEHALYVHPSTGIKIVPASITGGLVTRLSKLKSIMYSLAKNHDFVIIDCPPGLGKEVVASISAIDSGIIITTPDFPSVADALKTIHLLDRMKKRVIGLVVNRHRGERYELTIPEIESICGIPVIATIPEDMRVAEGVSEGMPAVILYPHNRASHAFKKFAGGLVGEKYRPKNFLVRIFSTFYKKPDVQIGSSTEGKLIPPASGRPSEIIRDRLRANLKRDAVSRAIDGLAQAGRR